MWCDFCCQKILQILQNGACPMNDGAFVPIGAGFCLESIAWSFSQVFQISSKIDPGVRNGHVWVVLQFSCLKLIHPTGWHRDCTRIFKVCECVPVRTISTQMLSDQWCIPISWQTHWACWWMDSKLMWTNEGKDTADWHISMSYKSLRSPFQRNFNHDLRNVCLPECCLDESQALDNLDTWCEVSNITIGFGVLSSGSQHLFWWIQLDLKYWKCKDWMQKTSTWVKLVYDIMFFLWYLMCRIDRFFPPVSSDIKRFYGWLRFRTFEVARLYWLGVL